MPSTNEALLDVNILIAAIFEDHEHHARARRFVEEVACFYTCPTTQGGFLRFAKRSHKDRNEVSLPPRLSMEAALEALTELMAAEGHLFLPDGLSFADLAMRSLTGHRQWTDAYLLQLASHHGLRFASLDRRVAKWEHPHSRVFLEIP